MEKGAELEWMLNSNNNDNKNISFFLTSHTPPQQQQTTRLDRSAVPPCPSTMKNENFPCFLPACPPPQPPPNEGVALYVGFCIVDMFFPLTPIAIVFLEITRLLLRILLYNGGEGGVPETIHPPERGSWRGIGGLCGWYAACLHHS